MQVLPQLRRSKKHSQRTLSSYFRRQSQKRRSHRLLFEQLEDRRLLAGVVKVNPGNMDGWAVQTSGTATVTFEPGPAVPPLGVGSVELAVGTNGNSGAQVRNNLYAGTQLSDLTTLRYSTYVDNDSTNPSAGPDQAPYIILNVDLDGNLSTTSDRTLLFFEPEYQFGYTTAVPPQGPIVMDAWQEWDALIGGWWSTTGAAGAGPGADVKPLSTIIAAYPNATIVNSGTNGLTGLGGVRIVAGFGAGAWDNFVGNADKFIIGVNLDTTTYDFDPGPVITSISDIPDPSDEGEEVTVTATYTGVAATATIDWGDGTTTVGVINPLTNTVTGTHTYLDDNPSGTPSDPYTITVTVTDPFANVGVRSEQHTVENVAPVIQTFTGPLAPQPVGTPVTVMATFTDQGTQDTHTYVINWGDGDTSSGVAPSAAGAGSASDTHTYTEPGVYVVTITIIDDDTGFDTMRSDEAEPIPFFVVIFDAQGGFVTGGGWYNSPAGAAPTAPTATGKAQFGLNAKFHTGEVVPRGQVHLNFKPANIKFRSTELTFLGVAGNTATIRGEGTNNNTGTYAFRLEATDHGEPGDDDTLHIKIWQKVDPLGANETFVLYDNLVPTPLGGGNIQVHMDSNGLLVGADVNLSGGHMLTTEALERAFGEAITRWSTEGVDSEALAAIAQTKLHVLDLPDSWLGLAGNAAVGIDADAAGRGWAINGASSGLDLVTVVTHEVGHLLGLDHHEDHGSVMAATLQPDSQFSLENGPGFVLTTSSLPPAGALLVAVDFPLQHDADNLSPARTTLATGELIPALATAGDTGRARWWNLEARNESVTAAAVRDALDMDVSVWLLTDPAIAPSRSADADLPSATRGEVVGPQGDYKSGERLVAPVPPSDTSARDREYAVLPSRPGESELPSADQAATAVAEEASLEAALPPEDSEPALSASSWSQALESYFAGDWEADLSAVAVAAAATVVVLSGHRGRKEEEAAKVEHGYWKLER